MSVQLASKVQDEFWVEKDGEQINGESIMGLKAVACGSSNWVITDGPDQQAAMLALQELLTTRSPVS